MLSKSIAFQNALIAMGIAFVMLACGVHRAPHTANGEPLQKLGESYVSKSFVPDNLDSIAIFPNNQHPWAIVTAKATDALMVFDMNTGSFIRRVGSTGTNAGELKRPNGVWANDQFVLVVERDNHRVQVFSLPEFKSIGMFGTEDLKKPYGLSCHKDLQGRYQVYVTDDFPLNAGTSSQERVKHYEIRVEGHQLYATKKGSFGAPNGQGLLFKVESILSDPAHNRLFIADEKGPSVGIKIYDLAGKFTGHKLATDHFEAEPEGIAIYPTGPESGYLVATDQQATFTVFHLYDRKTLAHLGQFRGAKTANTDGIAVTHWSTEAFPKGALWAIHDDQALAAFDWRTIQAQIP